MATMDETYEGIEQEGSMCCTDPVSKDVVVSTAGRNLGGSRVVMNRKLYVDQLVERGFDREDAERWFQHDVERGAVVEAVCCE